MCVCVRLSACVYACVCVCVCVCVCARVSVMKFTTIQYVEKWDRLSFCTSTANHIIHLINSI
jgi:hypothetical protein